MTTPIRTSVSSRSRGGDPRRERHDESRRSPARRRKPRRRRVARTGAGIDRRDGAQCSARRDAERVGRNQRIAEQMLECRACGGKRRRPPGMPARCAAAGSATAPTLPSLRCDPPRSRGRDPRRSATRTADSVPTMPRRSQVRRALQCHRRRRARFGGIARCRRGRARDCCPDASASGQHNCSAPLPRRGPRGLRQGAGQESVPALGKNSCSPPIL